MSVAERSQSHLRDMWSEIENLNTAAAGQTKHINEVSKQIHQHVLDAMISLQFDDLVKQLFEQIQYRSELLENYMLTLHNIERESDSEDGLERFQQRTSRIENAIAASRLKFAELDEKHVKQHSVDIGSVDIFWVIRIIGTLKYQLKYSGKLQVNLPPFGRQSWALNGNPDQSRMNRKIIEGDIKSQIGLIL